MATWGQLETPRYVPEGCPSWERSQRVQLAKCWKPRVSGATTRCHNPKGKWQCVVTMRPVRTIRRKGQELCSGPSASLTGKSAFVLRSLATRRDDTAEVQPNDTAVREMRKTQREHFQCGGVGQSGRHDSLRQDLWRFCVWSPVICPVVFAPPSRRVH
jgi:hypothetical protein